MNEVIEIKVLDSYNIRIKFKDGFEKEIDFSQFINKGLSEKLIDKDYFKLVEIESGGGITWPNGFDFCPNYLREFAEK